MKLKITSAYELLETRLGLGVRMLGAVFFLAMRLVWMAVIIYRHHGQGARAADAAGSLDDARCSARCSA